MMKKMNAGLRLAALLGLGIAVPACNYGYNNNGYYNGPIAWYVDPKFGGDAPGNGSPAYPFKTIGYALQQAISGDSIILAAGFGGSIDTYSTLSNGESFPILVKPGVSIIGDASTTGTSTVVTGQGLYTVSGGSQNAAQLQATFVMGEGSSLTGVSVTSAGTTPATVYVGVVFDGTNGSLSSCTVTGCSTSGVQIFQTAKPALSGNTITQSGAAGVVTYDTSAPVLRQNTITANTTEGVLAQNASVPDLGTPLSPGGNNLKNNTAHGLNNNTGSTAISASGNTWNPGVQGADAVTGQYPVSTAANSGLVGTNYIIAAGGSISF